MSRRRGRCVRAKEKMPPSKIQQLSRKLRSSKKIQPRKKKLLFKGNKQKPTTKKLKKIKIEEDSETLETNDVQVPDNKEVLPIFEEPGEPEVEQKEEETVSEEKKPVISEEINAIIQSEETEELDMQPKSDEENLQEISKNCAEENMEIDIPPVDEQSKNSEENTVEIDSGIEGMSPEKDAENNVTSLHNVCSVCNVVTDSSASLTLHMKQHSLTNNQTHQCLICKKSLSSASSLDRHMLVHSGERPFKCKVCDMSFTTNGNMHRHMRTHGEFDTSNFPLSLDLRKKDTQVEDSENVSKSLEEKLHCPVCGKAFLCKYGLQTHMETHPNDPILCQKCKTISVNYTAHVEHKCNIQNSDTPAFGFHDLTFMDFTANKFSLVSKSYCEQNVKRPSSAFHIFECSECKKAFPCGRALKMHQQVHESKIGTFCPSCRCDFAATPFLQVHQLKHRSAEHCLHHDSNQSESQKADKQLPHASKEDFLALLNLQTKQSHLAVLKSMNTVQVKEDDYENMDYFIHGKGGKKNQKGDSDGNNNNDFADIQSIISLTSKAPLIPVAQSSPVAVRPASPYVATKQPKSPQIAESANASPETPSKEEILSSHDNQDVPDVGSTDIPGVYSCNICSQQFKNIGTLKRHCKLHVQRGSNYSCHLCSYVSVDKSTLIRHLRTHNGERPFQCVICKYAFTTKANCERHVRKRHKKFGKAEIRNSMQYNPNMSLRGSDPTSSEIGNTETVCKYCGVDFKFNRVLRHHLRSLHNSCNRKPFSCKICKFGFSTKNNCIRHVLKQHPNLKDKLRSVVIPNSMMPQIRNTEEKTHSEISSSSPSQTVGEQSQPLDLHCETSEKPLNLQTEKSAQEFANEAVIAAEGLVSLSEALPLQDEPLDLAVHPLDLTCKPLAAVTKKYNPKPSSIFCTSPNSNSKPIGSVDLTTAKSLPAPENRLQIERLPSHMQVERLPCVNNLKQIENTSQNEISFTSPGQKMRAFTCIYCKAGFTLKSNMERHIKRKHPEFARPTRSRNYIPSIVTPNLQKQNPTTTLSDKTRDALRHVLNNKVQQVPVYKAFNTESFSKIGGTFKIVSTANNFIAQSNNTVLSPAVNVSLDLSGKTRNVTIVDINPTNLKLPENNEENCSDLASVSSVICTANSPQFKQYLEKPAEIEKMDISQKESKKTDETVNIKKNDMPSVSCPFCDRKFPWTSSLRRHILTHTGQKPFKCPKCSLWFTTKSNCERHLIRKHGHKGDLITRSVPDRPYKCNHCLTSTFSTQGNLRKHFYLKHWTKSYLGMNCKTVQPENSPTSPVENKSELSISAVTSQEHSYSQIERKLPHSCHFCDKSFENIIGLSSHMFEHNNVVYKCYLCKKTFPSHDICFSHFKTSHSLVYTQVIQNDKVWFNFTEDFCKDLPEVSSADSEAYLIACMVCFQKMSSIESLQQHFKKHLAKDKPSDDQDFAVSKDSPNKVIQSPSKVVPSPSKEDSVNLEHSQPNALAQSKKLRATKNKVKNSLLYFFTPNSNCNSSIKSIKTTNSKLDASQDDESDLIQNLLGIHDSKMIDEMLVSADSAARLLGVEEV